jgi:hypothetical protein
VRIRSRLAVRETFEESARQRLLVGPEELAKKVGASAHFRPRLVEQMITQSMHAARNRLHTVCTVRKEVKLIERSCDQAVSTVLVLMLSDVRRYSGVLSEPHRKLRAISPRERGARGARGL